MLPKVQTDVTDRPCVSVLALVVLFLCVGIFMQLLGAPITLWDAGEALNPSNIPVSEGFSMPSEMSKPSLHIERASFVSIEQLQHTPLLTAVPFHPPVR